MSHEEFEALVRKAEAHAARNPGVYRARLAALGGLGYAYVWILLLLALGSVAAVIVGAIGWEGFRIPRAAVREAVVPLLVFAGVLVKALWVRLEAPAGEPLPRSEFPELHRTLDRIRKAVRGPRIHRVLLDEQFNASITQIPRLGVFGWHRNHLVLGLPLMLSLEREEFEAVLAHEYGHLSGAHGKFGAWIYRIRMTWVRLMEAFDERGGFGSFVVTRFLDWYAPYFQAYSFAFARANEYEADRAAAGFVGAGPAGAALTRISVLAPYLHGEYWPAVHREADASPVPRGAPFAGLARTGFTASPEQRDAFLETALREQTDLSDTHPSLSDRLAALGVEPGIPPLEGPTAAEVFLGERLPDLVAAYDERWRQRVAPYFAHRHAHVRAARERLAELESGIAPLGVDELLERARILDEVEGREAALPTYRMVLRADPAHPLARCIVGFARVKEGDEAEGVAMMEAAMEDDPGLALYACQALRDHFAGEGRMEEAREYHRRATERAEEERAMQEERGQLPFDEVYDPPDLEPDSLERVVRVLEEDERVRRAWLVRKRLVRSGEPLYVAGVAPTMMSALTDDMPTLCRELAERLDVPEEILVVVLTGDSKPLGKLLEKVPGARVV